jgi:hypothetical protein
VRGFANAAAGSDPCELLGGGREPVARAAATWRIPVATLEAGKGEEWAASAADAVTGLVA